MLKNSPRPLPDHVDPLEIDYQRRRALGIYYTPRSAAALLARWAIRDRTDTVLEPSFGGCTILEAAVDRLRALGCRRPANQIFGYDVDKSAFTYLRRLLGEGETKQFSQENFLSARMPSPVDAVIANPPFVSYHRMDQKQREVVRSWRSRHSPTFAMTASLWAYFVLHSLSFLKMGGRIAFVLPSAATSSDYARPVMQSIGRHFSHVALFRVSEQLFIQAGAEERTVILLAEDYRPNGTQNSNFFERSVLTLVELEQLLNQVAYTGPGQQSNTAARSAAAEAISHARSSGVMLNLGDIARATIGEVIGDTPFFVKTLDDWERLKIPERYLRPIVTRTRQLPGIRITKPEVEAFYGAVPRLLVAANLRVPKSVAAYLGQYSLRDRELNATFAKRDPWYAVSYDCSAAAFIGSLSHSSPRIVLNIAKLSCGNGLYKLAPRSGQKWNSLLTVASLTSAFRLSAEMYGRVLGSGALKLEPSDVNKLLVPSNVPKLSLADARALLAKLDRMVRQGEHESATREADEVLYIRSGALAPAVLSAIRNSLQDLRGERLPSR